jgi:hypothetical protein
MHTVGRSLAFYISTTTTSTFSRVQDEQLTASYRDETAKKLRLVEELSGPSTSLQCHAVLAVRRKGIP